MTEVVAALEWLSETFPSTNAKLAVTFAAVGFLLIVMLSYQQLQRLLTERMRPLYGDVASMATLIATSVLVLAVVVGVWDLTSEIRYVYQELDLGGAVVARSIFSFVLVTVTYIITRFVRRVLEELLGSAQAVTDHQREVTHRISQVTIWSLALIVVLGVWVDDLGSLLVGAGFFGIVVGMAARQTLGTILAGFILMFDRPFEIGDWIEVGGEEGIVTDISIVNTRIRSFDGEYVMVPNDVISAGVLTNRSKRGRLRVEIEVGVDYGTDLERAADLAREAVAGIDRSLSAPAPQVVSKSFGDSAVVLGVRFWIDRPTARRYTTAQSAAIGAIKRAFEADGIKIPYPQRELSGRAETGGFRVTGDASPIPDGNAGSDAGSTASERDGESKDGQVPATEDD